MVAVLVTTMPKPNHLTELIIFRCAFYIYTTSKSVVLMPSAYIRNILNNSDAETENLNSSV